MGLQYTTRLDMYGSRMCTPSCMRRVGRVCCRSRSNIFRPHCTTFSFFLPASVGALPNVSSYRHTDCTAAVVYVIIFGMPSERCSRRSTGKSSLRVSHR